MPRTIASRLLTWYARHGRRLPWRGARDPYRVWVSEIMLQQTQVETVIPYYRRWLKRFPTVRALAAASERAVLQVWEGLGYYSRARNLHRAAQQVVSAHDGRLPATPAGLRALPGIGRYTAAAIASICFKADTAVLDGNVKRVLARVFDFREDVKSPRGEARLWDLAQSLAPAGRAGDYNQAVMDLGALVCTPRAPACAACPLRTVCRARALGAQLERPIARPARAVPRHTFSVAVIWKAGRVLLVRRPSEGLLGGLWAFPAARAAEARPAIRAELGIRISAGAPAQHLTHAFTHQRWTLNVFDCRWLGGALKRGAAARWVRPADLGRYPMGKPDRQISRRLQGG
jgi:A/G-specific adenine glycosylase